MSPLPTEPRDRRVSVAVGAELALLFTYLGILRSDLGREFERTIAIRVTPDRMPVALLDSRHWLEGLREPQEFDALWERHFAAWASDIEASCRDAAQAAFDQLAAPFLTSHRGEQAFELRQLEQWLLERTHALCGARQAQLSLVAPKDNPPAWRTASDPLERLAGLKSDMTVDSSRRQLAGEVLSIHRERRQHVNRRQCREPMVVTQIGMLLLVPEVGE